MHLSHILFCPINSLANTEVEIDIKHIHIRKAVFRCRPTGGYRTVLLRKQISLLVSHLLGATRVPLNVLSESSSRYQSPSNNASHTAAANVLWDGRWAFSPQGSFEP